MDIEEQRLKERQAALDFVDWLHAHRPLTLEYDYQVSFSNRLSMTPTVGVYLVSRSPEGDGVLGGVEVECPVNWDILDVVRYLQSEAEKDAYDLRDFMNQEKDPEH